MNKIKNLSIVMVIVYLRAFLYNYHGKDFCVVKSIFCDELDQIFDGNTLYLKIVRLLNLNS